MEREYRAVWDKAFEKGRWEQVRISEIGRVGNGTTPSRKKNDYWEGGNFPWLSSGKIHEKEIVTADEFITDLAVNDHKSSIFPAGSVLVAMIGQGKTRGTAAYMGIEACINQNLAAIVPGESVSGRFLYYCLDGMYESFRNLSHGSNQGSLNCNLIGQFKIPLMPKKEQRDFVEMMDRVTGIMGKADEHITRSSSLQRVLWDQID